MPTVFTPPVSTYVPIATVTLASTDAEIVFSSIPATYRDLILVFNGSAGSSAAYIIRANGDAGNNYSNVFMVGTGSTAVSGGSASTSGLFQGTLNTNRTSVIAQIMDYSASDKHTTCLTRLDIPAAETAALASRWANTAAVTSIAAVCIGNFAIGSTFSLYGIE